MFKAFLEHLPLSLPQDHTSLNASFSVIFTKATYVH